ncbi:MAG: tetratricopeptide repeat protein [Bacteroidota bacterium]
MEAENNVILFRKKVLGHLSDEETQAFEQRIETDKEFRKSYFEYKELFEVISVAEKHELKNHLKNLSEPSFKKFRYRLPIAATILFLLGAFWLYRFNSGPDGLYETYFDTYPNVIAPATRGSEPQNVLEEAYRNYDSGNFEAAALEFEKHLENQANSDVSFYHAMALLNSGQLDEAKTILESLPKDDPDFAFADETQWYLALIYLKLENTEQTKGALLQLETEGNGFKADEIKSLLSELD